MREKVLITGAGGFIGHHLARHLKRKGNYVRGVDIIKPQFSGLEDFDKFNLLDLRNIDNCSKSVKGVHTVYALAAKIGNIEYLKTTKADIIGHNSLINLNTAKSCVKHKVDKLFFPSTSWVYPKNKQTKIRAESLKEKDAYPADPDSEYGWEKLFSERIFQAYHDDYGLDISIARFCAIYGPEISYDYKTARSLIALSRKVIEAGDGGTVNIWGDGRQTRSFLYIDDCINAIEKLMSNPTNSPVNIDSKRLISINKLVDSIAQIENINIKKKHQLKKIQGVRGRHSDTTKAKRLLGWKEVTPLEKGLTAVNNFLHKELQI